MVLVLTFSGRKGAALRWFRAGLSSSSAGQPVRRETAGTDWRPILINTKTKLKGRVVR